MSFPLRATALAALAGLSAACGEGAAPPPCPAPRVSLAGWHSVTTAVVRYRLPPGFHPAPPAIADSWIRRYLDAGGRTLLQLDYGPAPGTAGIGVDGRCTEEIGGRPATLLTGRAASTQTRSRYVASVVWHDVEPGTSLSLPLWAEAPDPERLGMLLAAARTVRFQPREAPRETASGGAHLAPGEGPSPRGLGMRREDHSTAGG
jgi:hypothetical protein